MQRENCWDPVAAWAAVSDAMGTHRRDRGAALDRAQDAEAYAFGDRVAAGVSVELTVYRRHRLSGQQHQKKKQQTQQRRQLHRGLAPCTASVGPPDRVGTAVRTLHASTGAPTSPPHPRIALPLGPDIVVQGHFFRNSPTFDCRFGLPIVFWIRSTLDSTRNSRSGPRGLASRKLDSRRHGDFHECRALGRPDSAAAAAGPRALGRVARRRGGRRFGTRPDVMVQRRTARAAATSL